MKVAVSVPRFGFVFPESPFFPPFATVPPAAERARLRWWRGSRSIADRSKYCRGARTSIGPRRVWCASFALPAAASSPMKTSRALRPSISRPPPWTIPICFRRPWRFGWTIGLHGKSPINLGLSIPEARNDPAIDQLRISVRARHRIFAGGRGRGLGVRVGNDRLRLRDHDHLPQPAEADRAVLEEHSIRLAPGGRRLRRRRAGHLRSARWRPLSRVLAHLAQIPGLRAPRGDDDLRRTVRSPNAD